MLFGRNEIRPKLNCAKNTRAAITCYLSCMFSYVVCIMVENFHSIKLNVLIKQTKYFCSTNCWKIRGNLDAWPRHAIPNKTYINTTHKLTQSQKNRRKTHYSSMNASMLIFILFISLLFTYFFSFVFFFSYLTNITHLYTEHVLFTLSRRCVKKLSKREEKKMRDQLKIKCAMFWL